MSYVSYLNSNQTMKKYFIIVVACLLGGSAWSQKVGNPEIIVSSYNIRMDTPSDSINAWPNRKENVKALIQYHDFDIMGTQEGFKHQLEGLLEMPGYAYIGAGRDDGKDAGEH